jgi:hypothetical protein
VKFDNTGLPVTLTIAPSGLKTWHCFALNRFLAALLRSSRR